MATMTINVNGNPIIPCSEGIVANGNLGIYDITLNVGTSTGITGIKYNSYGIPDRFEIYYNESKVADSKFVGNNISYPGNPMGGTIAGTYNLNNYIYNGSEFVATGEITPTNITSAEFANNITEATRSMGTLLFNKITNLPATIKIIVTGGPSSGTTAWDLEGICPIQPQDLLEGEAKFIYGFFTEANKGNQTQSSKLFLGTSPNKFYTNILGDTNFNNFGYLAGAQYMNDGTTWWRIDATGNILETGLL